MSQPELLIIVTTPEDYVDPILEAVASVGGGQIGAYTHCAFTTSGTGRFQPSAAATPHVGSVGKINAEPEVRIETFCTRKVGKAVLQAIRSAHPYEEPVIYIVPLLSADDL